MRFRFAVLCLFCCQTAMLLNSANGELIAYFPFDGDATDASGNGFDGDDIDCFDCDAGPFTGFDGIGGAFEFDGQSHVVVPIDINPTEFPQMTVTMWVKPDESIVDSPGLYKTFGHDDGGWDRTFGLDNRQGDYRYAAFTGGAKPGPTDATDTEVTEDWTFLAAVWDAENEGVRFHANGDFVTDVLNDTPSVHASAAIGNLRPDNFAEGWVGLIDDVRIFDEALSVEQVNNVFESGETDPNPRLLSVLNEFQEPHDTNGVPATARGLARFDYSRDSNQLSWDINWDGLSGNATGMHLHGPAGIGEAAGVVVNIGDISGLNSPSAGMTTLTDTQADQLLAGDWYLNIHTAANGPGEIRGQVKRELISSWNGGIGFWDSSNWSNVPNGDRTVLVDGEGTNVIGPATDTAVRSVTIGGGAELRLQDATLSAPEGLSATSGRVVGAGILDGPIAIPALGELTVLSGEKFQVNGQVRPVAGVVNALGDLVFQHSVTTTAESQINVTGATLTVPSNGVKDDVGLTNRGMLNLTSATIVGDVHSPAGSTINVGEQVTFQDLVSGAADFPGSGLVTFNGGFSPGDSPATMSFGGDLAFGDENTLTIEIGGTAESEFDQLNISGDVTLGGSLELELLDEFQPKLGDEFVLMNFGSRNGTEFGNVIFPSGMFRLDYSPSSLSVTVVPEPSGVIGLLIGLPWLIRLTRRRGSVEPNRRAFAKASAGLLAILLFVSAGANIGRADLIAYYPFDDDSSDASGNGNDGFEEGDAAPAGPFSGVDGIGGAYEFFGNGHVNIPIDINPDAIDQLSVTMWVKPDESIVDAPGLYKTFGHDDGGWDRTFGLDNRQGPFRYAAFTGGAGPGPTDETDTPVTGDWTFLAALWDSSEGEVTMFVNENSVTQTLNDTFSAHVDAAIGNLRPDNFSEGWVGLIDEVRIYDQILTESEIDDLMDLGGTVTLTAELHQDQENHATIGVSPDARGSATVQLNKDTNMISWSVEWDQLSGPPVGMHLHGDAARGADAGVQINIGDIGGLTSPSTGSVAITDAQKDALDDGNWYVNIHTPANGPGEIRGQLLADSPRSAVTGSGLSWDDSASWDGSTPDTGSTVSIQPSASQIMIGPSADTAVRQLTLNSSGAGIAELQMRNGISFDAFEGINIGNGGRLVANGQLSGPLSVAQGGELVVMSGDTLSVNGTPRTVHGTVSILGALASERALTIGETGIINVLNGSLDVGTTGLSNNGKLNLTNATINGSVDSSSDINVVDAATFNGKVSGPGNFSGAGETTFNGGYAPGDSPAQVSFEGDLVFGDGNTLEMEIGGGGPGTGYDKIVVSGSVTLDGTLDVDLINAFIPADNSQFVLMEYGSRTGTFDTMNLPGDGWSVNVGDTSLVLQFGEGNGLLGDFDLNGVLDSADIDALTNEVVAGSNNPAFDLNGDNLVDSSDRLVWVNDLKNTYLGDSNLDGEFSSSDFVHVFSRGKYEDDIPENAGWDDGDWNGDLDFTTNDLVRAFQVGAYEKGPRPAQAVPEPAMCLSLLLAAVALIGKIRK